MRNLILLLRKYFSFIIFLILELICLIIVVRNNHFQQSAYLNSSKAISGSLYQRKEQVTGFIRLRQQNDSLMKENALLRGQIGFTQRLNPLKDSEYIRILHGDSVNQTIHYHFIPARVINNSVDQKMNYLTLQGGRLQGIRKRMAVIGPRGIVGRITHVSDNYSVAVSFLSERFHVSAMVSDSTVGTLFWDGDDPEYAILKGLPQSVKLKLRDSVFTSGYGDFPERMFIGRAAQRLEGNRYKIHLSTNFRRLHFVYIIAEEVNIERKALEDSTRNTL